MAKPAGKLATLEPSDEFVTSASRQRPRSARLTSEKSQAPPLVPSPEPTGPAELTVCDITGDWGPYQWSLCLFSACYTALSSFVVMFGPILTPDMAHVCLTGSLEQTTTTSGVGNLTMPGGLDAAASTPLSIPAADRRECFVSGTESTSTITNNSVLMNEAQQLKCTSFLYNQLGHGLMLTDGFDLVCERRWLRSLVSTAALIGMLISSVTLSLFSDKFGRLRCVQLGFVIAFLANVVCLVARDYFLFCACVALISFAQMGAVNALFTLIMEATSHRFRYVPGFQYIAGWSAGVMLSPLLNELTHDYRLYMSVLLAWQLLMLPWLHWGVTDSIRWLLSEGHLERAQIELGRVCRMNNVRMDKVLAQLVAHTEAQQVHKASLTIDHGKLAPARKSFSSRIEPNGIRKLNADRQGLQSDAIGLRSYEEDNNRKGGLIESYGDGQTVSPAQYLREIGSLNSTLPQASNKQRSHANGVKNNNKLSDEKSLLTRQILSQLAMRYSKKVELKKSSQFFLVQMFHPKLWRQTAVLILASVTFETTYFGLMVANKFVGDSINLNYVTGALGDLASCFLTLFLMVFLSRRWSFATCILMTSLICLAMALSYQLIPDRQHHSRGDNYKDHALLYEHHQPGPPTTNWTTPSTAIAQPLQVADETNLNNPISTFSVSREDSLRSPKLLTDQVAQTPANNRSQTPPEDISRDEGADLIALRQNINFYVMILGKLIISSGVSIGDTLVMEAYPNNLRQTSLGAISFVGRVGSILAPFLFDDTGPDRLMFKTTLVVLGAIGLLVCCLIPVTIPERKDKDLCDQMDDIE